MRIRLVAAVCLFAALFAFAGAALASEATPRKAEGEGAQMIAIGADPVLFELKSLGEQEFKLADYLGKNPVLIVFWSLFCGPCQEELPMIDELGKKYSDQGLKVFTINLDGEKRLKAVQKYMDNQGFGFEVLWEKIDGTSYVTADAYGVGGTPTLLIIAKSGKVHYTHVGNDTKEHLEEMVKAAMAN